MLKARELRDRVGIGQQGQEEQSSIWLAMQLHWSGLQLRALMGREGIVRQMLEAGARRAEASLFVYYQGMVELLPTPQYGGPVSLTHPDDDDGARYLYTIKGWLSYYLPHSMASLFP